MTIVVLIKNKDNQIIGFSNENFQNVISNENNKK